MLAAVFTVAAPAIAAAIAALAAAMCGRRRAHQVFHDLDSALELSSD